MLCGAETLSADSGVVDQTFVEALVRERPLAAEGSTEMPETLVAEGAVHQVDIIPEVARCSRNQILCGCSRVCEMPVALDDEPKRFQGGQQGHKPVFRDAGCGRQEGQRIGAAGNVVKRSNSSAAKSAFDAMKP